MLREIRLTVSDGDIALAVHFTDIAERDGMLLLPCGDRDGACRCAEAVLFIICDIVDHEGGRKRFQRGEQLVDLLLIHRKRRVVVILHQIADFRGIA